MAGILNSKQRIMDTIITKEGRRQIPTGELKLRYVSFTDRHTFYACDEDDHSVAEDCTDRIQLEAISRPQDQIIFETDDEGALLSFAGADIKIGAGGQLYKIPPGALKEEAIIEDHAATSKLVDELMAGAEQNFRNQQITATADNFSETSNFEIFPSSMKFRVTDKFPLTSMEITEASINDVECLYQDKRLQHLPFYKYLPPTNKTLPYEDAGRSLGNYPQLNQPEPHDIHELEALLEHREKIEILFKETSRENNIVIQFLEAGTGKIEKLAMIDFGEFPNEDPYSPGKHVFFVGKMFADGNGMHTYVNMFVMVLE